MNVHVVNGMLNAEELRWTRDLIRRSAFVAGTETAAGVARTVKANEHLNPMVPDQQRLVEMVLAAVRRNRVFFRAVMPIDISMMAVNRYAQGMHYGPHYDNALLSAPDGRKVRADLSVTLFISDPADYDGGELCFAIAGRPQRIKLAAGDLVAYPSGMLHNVEPVTRGERLAIIFWVQSMVRCHEQRMVLADLDGLVGRLAERLPDSDETRDLAGAVHRLTRMWVDL